MKVCRAVTAKYVSCCLMRLPKTAMSIADEPAGAIPDA